MKNVYLIVRRCCRSITRRHGILIICCLATLAILARRNDNSTSVSQNNLHLPELHLRNDDDRRQKEEPSQRNDVDRRQEQAPSQRNDVDRRQEKKPSQTAAVLDKPRDERALAYLPSDAGKCKTTIPTHLLVPEVDLNDCSLPYVIMHTKGQLGNNICQYLSMYVLRLTFGIRVCTTKPMISTLGRIFQNISHPIEDHKCFNQPNKSIKYYKLYDNLLKKANEFTNGNDSASKPNLLTATYRFANSPCTRKITSPFRNFARELLTFKDKVLKSAVENVEVSLRSIDRTREGSTLITVHVRRGDYIPYMKQNFKIPVVTETYFRRAFNYYRNREKNPVFLVVSDDPTWCQKNLQAKDVVIGGSKKHPEVDMAIISLGDHHIIVYGTFGYMGALLGHGTIVYPVDKKHIYAHYDCCDPKVFIPISRDEDDVA